MKIYLSRYQDISNKNAKKLVAEICVLVFAGQQLSVGLVIEAEAACVLVYGEVLEGGHLEGAGQDPLLLLTQHPHLTPMICRYIDEGVVWGPPDWGPLAKDTATKLKRGQLCVLCMCRYCEWCTLFPPVAEICASLAGNFCQ